MSGVHCTCQTPNTRQTAFARANGYICPDCGRTLGLEPSTRTGQRQQTIGPTDRSRSPHRQTNTQFTTNSPRGITTAHPQSTTHNPHLSHNRPGTHITPHWSTPLRTRQITQTPPRAPLRTISLQQDSEHRQRRNDLGHTRRQLWSTHNKENKRP